jgi:hypothetical protein
LKSKLFLSVLAAAFASFIPVAANCQVAPERVPTEPTGPVYKNEAYLGWGYTSLNQVNGSRSGLQGITGSYTRHIGEHMGLVGDFGHYAWDVSAANPGNPSVDLYLVGLEAHANLYEKFSGFVRGLIGTEHTGGVNIQPDYSVAGGVGLGVDYNHSARWSIRAYGDYIGASFTLVPYETGNSTHARWNGRGGAGVVYHF